MRLFLLLIALAGALVAAPARAEFVSGNELHSWCSTSQSSALYYQNTSSCREFIVGVHDGMEAAESLVTRLAGLDAPLRMLCVPERVTAGQLKEIVANYIRSNPATRHESANYLVILALMEAYPCPSAG